MEIIFPFTLEIFTPLCKLACAKSPSAATQSKTENTESIFSITKRIQFFLNLTLLCRLLFPVLSTKARIRNIVKNSEAGHSCFAYVFEAALFRKQGQHALLCKTTNVSLQREHAVYPTIYGVLTMIQLIFS